MSQRRWRLLLLFFCFFAGPAFGQTLEFLDAQGNSLSGPYFEGSRAYLRVVDPAVSTSVDVQVAASMSGDVEMVSLAETGAGTGVFEGSIELSIAEFPEPADRLQTSRDVSHYPPTFDSLTATYGAASDTAPMVGSTVETTDAAGNPAATFVVGDTLYFRVVDAQQNTTAGVDTTAVLLYASVRNYAETERPILTETGPDTSTFEGSIQTMQGIDPVQSDGILELEPTDVVEISNSDFNGQTYSRDEARGLSSLPVTIGWTDIPGQPLAQAYEFSALLVRVTDGGSAGLGSLYARVTSDLRGDEELIYLSEDTNNPGVFSSWVSTTAVPATSPPATEDGWLQVTELPGPPLQRDTLRAFLEDCSAPPCPTSAVPVVGSTTRLTDSQRTDLEIAAPGSPVFLEVVDWLAMSSGPSTTASIASPSGDFEVVTLDWMNEPFFGIFRGSIDVEIGAAVQGDGVLQVQEPDVVTASHLDPMGNSSSTDSATVASAQITFLDRAGSPVGFVLVNGDVRARAVYPAGNASPSAADTVTVTVRSRQFGGSVRDTETLQLVETGPNTAVFTGEIPSFASYWSVPGDGVLQIWQTNVQNDTVEAALESTLATAALSPGILRFVDASGADVTNLPEGGPLYLRLESDYGNDPTFQDIIIVRAFSLTTGDQEYFSLQETGLDTSVFAGSLPISTVASPFSGDHQLEVQPGETIRASYDTYFGAAVDLAVVGDGSPSSNPPNAVDDAVTTPDDLPVSLNVLANDSGQGLWIMSFTQGTQGGTVSDIGGGGLAYSPPPYFTGTDTFTYRVRDWIGDEDTATVTVTVQFVNDPPSANADAFTTDEDLPAVITPTDNDHDPEHQALRIIAVTQGSKGAVAIYDADLGYVSYTPQPNAFGSDSFTYTIQDPQGATDTATVSVIINPLQDSPVAVNDSRTTPEDTATTISVLTNDSDVDGDSLTITAVTQGSHGAVTFNASSVTYTPNANFNGSDSFSYTIGDGNGGTATATVSITISAVNDSPAAANDSKTTAEDTATTINVLTNDSDPDGGSLSITAVTQGTNGSVTFNANSVTYTPNANFNGSDSFTYSISDGNGGTATGTVAVTVSAVNDNPVAGNDAAGTNEDAAVAVNVLTNDSDLDGDTLAVSAVTQGTKGSVTFTASSVTYTPAANANGADSFTYTIGDGHGGSATATVSITITAVNDAPDAVNDAAGTNEDAAVIISVLANDTDVDGEAVILTGVTQGARGSVVQNGNGTVTYTPNPNTFGADAFTYTVRDTAGLTDTATVAVSVAPVNDPPDAVNDSATVNEGGNVVMTVLANDTDLEGNLTVTAASTPAHGTATINGNGTITYTPVSTYSGPDTFTYTISDGAATDTATVSVQVKEAIGNVAVLGTHSVWIQSGANVLSGDVVANEAGSAPFLGSAEVSIGGGGASTAAGWDVQGNRVTVASGAIVASDVHYNQLSGGGSISGAQYTPLALPIFATLPAFQSASPGSADATVANNGSLTLAPGSYRDLIVGRKATVTFTGGTYHFRSIQVDREAKLFFSGASGIRVQQKMSTGILVTIGPGSGSSATAASIVFYVGGINGTSGTLAATPKAVEVGSDNVVSANLYAPNGTLWLKDHVQATGSFLGRDVNIGGSGQISLMSAW